MGRNEKAKADTDLAGSPAKRGVGRSGRGAVRTVAPKEVQILEEKVVKKMPKEVGRAGGRKTSTDSNADTNKALSALTKLLNDKQKKAVAAKVDKSDAESSDESDVEPIKNEKDDEIVAKLAACAKVMREMPGGEDDSGALPKWGKTCFERRDWKVAGRAGKLRSAVLQAPLEHGQKLEDILEGVAPGTGQIWSEVLTVLREMEEGSVDAKREVVKALLTGGGLRAHLFRQQSVDSRTLRWLFNIVCYAAEDTVERAAFLLLADLLSGGTKAALLAGVADSYLTGSTCGASFLDSHETKSPVLEWVPNLRDFREVLDAYRYKEQADVSMEDDSEDEEEAGPSGKDADTEQFLPLPPNICSLLRLITVCAAARSTKGTFSAADIEGLLLLLARSSLDHQLYFAAEPLQAACEALTDSFMDAEWTSIGRRLVDKLASLSGRYIDNVRIALTWPCASSRSLDLKRSIAFKVLANMFKKPNMEKSIKGVVSLFKSVNFREVDCVYLLSEIRLADVFLRHLPALGDDLEAARKWIQILKSVQNGVKHIDPRPGASDVRQLASFALTKYDNEVEKLTHPKCL